MSYSSRLLIIAVGGCLTALIALTAASECAAQGDPAPEQNYSRRQPNSPGKDGAVNKQGRAFPEIIFVAPVIIPEQNKTEPGPYAPNCEQPKNVEDGNFCQQRRAAKAGEDAARAGEDAADVARWQLVLGFGGILGLVATVVLTYWAARAASNAANEASRSADLSGETLLEIKNNAERQLRAYVLAVQANVRVFIVGEPVEVIVRIKNTGQTPAYKLHHCMNMAMSSEPFDKVRAEIDFSEPHYATLGPSEFYATFGAFDHHIKLTQMQFDAVRSGKASIWVYGEVRYKDAFKRDRKTQFRFIFSGNVVTDPPNGMAHDISGNESD